VLAWTRVPDSAGTAHPRGRRVADRGHAAPVDKERPANGTRWGKRGSNPRGRPAGRPVDDVLPRASPGGYVPCLRGLRKPRFVQGPQCAVTRVTWCLIRPLTCANAGRIAGWSSVGSSIAAIGPISSQLVDNSVDSGAVLLPV
jgi:hypothetical protein